MHGVRVRLLACTVLFVVSGCSSSSEIEVDRKHCVQLRDRMVELRLAGVGSAVDMKAHRVAMRDALGDRFIESCEQLTVAQLECSLRASDLAAATACTRHSK